MNHDNSAYQRSIPPLPAFHNAQALKLHILKLYFTCYSQHTIPDVYIGVLNGFLPRCRIKKCKSSNSRMHDVNHHSNYLSTPHFQFSTLFSPFIYRHSRPSTETSHLDILFHLLQPLHMLRHTSEQVLST